MPQIFIGGEHIGGCTDLFDAWRNGALQKRLNDNAVSYDAEREPGSVLVAAEVAAAAQERVKEGA